MKISVIGCGYLGAVHAACMASLGHEVIGYDIDEAKISALQAGEAPFYEPGLPELLTTGVASGKLKFSIDPAQLAGAKVHFICVGTPQVSGGNAADLSYVNAAVELLMPILRPGDLVVGKSTVPVGTAEEIAQKIAPTGARLLWNPEFLREGFAVQDTLHPDRIVYGVESGDDTSAAMLDEIYSVALASGTPRMVTNMATAQLVKVAANSFLATKISFINAMAELCEATGADVTELADAIGLDERIGRRFLNAGIGFGGGCLPKDIRAFMARAEELGVDQALNFLSDVDDINNRSRLRMVDIALNAFGGSVADKKIVVLGAAFKPNSDDVRNSPALDIAISLHDLGANVVVVDPEAIHNARAIAPQLDYETDVSAALPGADAVMLLTEWSEFRELDPRHVGDFMANKIIFDGRAVLNADSWRAAGWEFRALGRP